MIRVVHLVSSLTTGGTEMMLYKLLRDTDRTAFSSVVVTLTEAGAIAERIRALGYTVECLEMRRGVPNPMALWKLYRILRRERPDVLQTWLYHSDLLGLLAGRLAGVPAIAWNIRCSVTDTRYARGMGGAIVRLLALLSGVPQVVVSNSNAGIDVHRQAGYRPRRWEVIPNGFEIDVFRPDAGVAHPLRGELGLPESARLVGLIARYDPLKDHETFLRAAPLLDGPHANVHFVLAGTGVVRTSPRLGALIREHHLERRVHLLGERKDIPSITAALDVATCCSMGEGFANVIGEAMACGVPVVATDVGDARSIIADTGIVVPPRQPHALAQGWRQILDLGPEARRALGASARARIAAHYELGAIAGRYEALYRELCLSDAA